jgi:membrane protein YdbS with pleckstrin-like domain
MTAHELAALKRRVLLTAVLTLVLFVTATYVHTAVGGSDWWLLAVAVVLYAAVVRPMMAPVRAATRLRRDLAYQAFLDGRQLDGRSGPSS